MQIVLYRPFNFGEPGPQNLLDLSCDSHVRSVHPLSSTHQTKKKRWTGSGLYIKYSIIFTENSFSPETSILLQLITNNSYGILDMNRNLTARAGSPPILNPKCAKQIDSSKKIFRGQGTHFHPFSQKEVSGNQGDHQKVMKAKHQDSPWRLR